jgi:SAM-dependent methyltransferase
LDDLGPVREHYASEGVVARVLAALRNVNGPEVPISPDTLAPIDHFHGKGAIATEELAAMLQPEASDHILDIGCGIGGPARWIASKYGCRITGVDLTPGFCEAARELNNLTGLAGRVNILHGSALAIPVPDASFDRAYSQAVLMNISDKLAFLREAFRVLGLGACWPCPSSALVQPENPTIRCHGPRRQPRVSSLWMRFGPICSRRVFRLSPSLTPVQRWLPPLFPC